MDHIKENVVYENWKLYCFVFVFSMAVHIVFMNFLSNLSNFDGFGIKITSDFVHTYEPIAKEIVQWLKNEGNWPHIPGYILSHLNYILLTSFIYLLFGVGDIFALINFQILITSVLFVLILHISINNYHSKAVAVIFTCLSISFYNSMMWVLWASPESFFRAMFICSFFVLLELYFNKKCITFFAGVLISFVLLLLIRADTIVLFLPIYMLCIMDIIRLFRVGGKASFIIVSLAGVMLAAIMWIFCDITIDMIKGLAEAFYSYFKEGDVLVSPPSSLITEIVIPFDSSQEGNSIYYIFRALKLFLSRVYYFLDIYPLWWTKGHKLYYALFMFPVYVFTVVGLIRSKQTKDRYFIMYFLVYLSSMILHGLTRVDSPLRNTLTSTTCLIMFSGYGFDYLYSKKRKHLALSSILLRKGKDGKDNTKGNIRVKSINSKSKTPEYERIKYKHYNSRL
jgi:hypothetical protein